MIALSHFARYAARWTLLLAALLHFAGAAAGPLTHAHFWEAGDVSSVLAAGGEHGSGLPPADAERGCYLCQALGAAAAPAPGAVGSLPGREAADALAEPNLPVHQRVALDTRARAPPLL
jgi:hypothetical protein